MCAVSNVGDEWARKFQPWIPHPLTHPYGTNPPTYIPPEDLAKFILKPEVTRNEFDELKAMVEQLRKDLAAAIEYDKETNQPDCQNEEKFKVLRAVAEALGMSLDDIIPPPAK